MRYGIAQAVVILGLTGCASDPGSWSSVDGRPAAMTQIQAALAQCRAQAAIAASQQGTNIEVHNMAVASATVRVDPYSPYPSAVAPPSNYGLPNVDFSGATRNLQDAIARRKTEAAVFDGCMADKGYIRQP